MPIDPGIILEGMAPPVKINTPFENLDTVVRAQHNQAVTRGLEREERDKALAEREQMAVRQILEQTGGDWETALPQIRRVAPDAAIKVEKHLSEARKERASSFKAELEAESALTNRYVARLRAVPDGDEEMYQFVRGQMARELPDEAAMLPETFDKARIDQFATIGLTAAEANTQQQKGLDRILDGKWREGAGTVFSTASSQEEWDEMATGMRELGMPAAELRQFGSFSPENVQRAGQLAMTPKERADLANAAEGRVIQREGIAATTARTAVDDARQASALAETMRHNRVSEGQAGQRLAQDKAGTGAGGAKLSAAAIEKIAGVDQSMGMLDDIERLLPTMRSAVGPMEGRVAKLKIRTGVAVSPQLAEFDAQLTGLKNAVIKATTGAAMSEPEATRIMGQLPDLSQTEAIFEARLKTTRRNLDMLKRSIIELSGGTVPAAPEAAPPPAASRPNPFRRK